MATTSELNEAVNEYQNTEQSAVKEAQEYKPFTIKLPKIGSVAERMRNMDLQSPLAEDYTQEAISSGFGTSRYDTDFYPGKDLEHSRALEQSGFAKIGSGLVKGGVTAATTAVNTTLGTIFGLGSALFELAADTNGNGRGFMDTMDAGVNNWLSNQLVKIQDWSETVLPNYRTEEERSEQYQREWYKHMGTANFIGDSLLKNFGFTVGAMVGGMAWTKVIGAGLSKALANNIMKGAVAASEGDAEVSAILKEAAAAVRSGAAKDAEIALGRAAQAVERGTAAAADYNQIANNIKQAARGINKMKAQLQLYGAAIGAMGEGTVEGVMARNEFMEDYTNKLNRKYAEEYNNVEQDIINNGNKDWVGTRVVQAPDGTLYEEKFLTEKGQQHAELMRRDITEHYANEKEFAEEQGRRLASTTFLLNLPVLTTSNLVQFGRMFSGGWSTARKNIVRGGIKEAAGELVGDFAGKEGSITAKAAFGTVKNALSEAFEEMAQGTISSGAKQVASYRLTDFNDQGYDDRATHSAKAWIENMYAGGKEYLGDIKNWQEGALGAITGLLGIPGRRWSGGMVGAIQDAREDINASRSAANTLNNLVNSKEFQDRWRGYIRHLKYDNDMENAVINDDEYAWHTADGNQLASDVISFANAGRLDDLKQVADHFANITEADAQSIRDVQKQENGDTEDWTKNLSDAALVSKVKEQADKIKVAIDDYAEMYDALKTRAPMNASDDFINEMLFSAMHIKQSDRRFLEMFGEVLGRIEPYMQVVASVADTDAAEKKETEAEKFAKIRDSYERLFAGALLPFRMPKQIQKSFDDAFSLLDNMTKEDEDLNKRVLDLKKISEDRQQYFKKLQTLRENKVQENGKTAQENFEEDKMTQEKQDIKAEQEFAEEETKELNTLADIQKVYHTKNAKEKVDFLNSLRAVADTKPAAKKFLDLKLRWDGFNEFLNTKYLADKKLPFDKQNLVNMVNDMLRLAKSEDELINIPDNIFSSYDEFALANKRVVLGAEMTPTMETYANIKQTIRDAMAEYLNTESQTASRKNIKTDKESTEKRSSKQVKTPDSPDMAQPASMEPAPVKKQKQEKAEESEPKPKETESVQPNQPVVAGEKPTEEELINLSTEPLKEDRKIDDDKKVSNNGGKKVKAYYNASMPETKSLTKDQRQDITGALGFKVINVDLRDFAVINNAFAEQWNAVNGVHGFDNIVTELETNDEIEFVIDPSYPPYDGKYQILLAVVKNGERKYLNVLSQQTSKFYGLKELRKAIDDEYKAFIEKNPNQLFVFSKKSKCWTKRSGLVDYDYTLEFDKNIKDIPKYSADAPIGFIDANGNLVIVDGNKRVPRSAFGRFADQASNMARDSKTGKSRQGKLFYFVKTDKNKYYPIGLAVEHFKSSNSNNDNDVFNKIRESLSAISTLTKEANADNVGKQNESLRKELERLGKYLNIDDVYFEIGDYDNVGVALKIVNNYKSKARREAEEAAGIQSQAEDPAIFRRNDQITDDWLVDTIANYGKSINIKLNKEGTGIEHFDELLNSGMITSNARMLRPKGMDFYFDAYNPETGEFEKMTADQMQAEKEFEEQQADEKAETAAKEDGPAKINTEVVGGAKKAADKAVPPVKRSSTKAIEENDKKREDKAEKAKKDAGIPDTIPPAQIMFSELTEKQQLALLNKGWTEEEFNDSSADMQQKALECISL